MLAASVHAAPSRAPLFDPIERFRLRSCAHKRSYPSRRVAKAIARATQRSAPERGHVNAYHCSFCDRWHVGHTGR
jgi:hypothetical protein